MLEGPDDRVEHELELRLRNAEQGREAVVVDRLCTDDDKFMMVSLEARLSLNVESA